MNDHNRSSWHTDETLFPHQLENTHKCVSHLLSPFELISSTPSKTIDHSPVEGNVSPNRTKAQCIWHEERSNSTGRSTYETISRTDVGRRLKNVTRTHRSFASSANFSKKTFFARHNLIDRRGKALNFRSTPFSLSPSLSPCQVKV